MDILRVRGLGRGPPSACAPTTISTITTTVP
jgi:hypothetical protein